MNEELQAKLVEIIGTIQTSVDKTTTFAMDQLPDIAQQYIAFGRATETLYFVVFLVGVLVLSYISFTQAKKAIAASYDAEILPTILSVVSGILSFLTLVGFLAKVSPFLMAWFAPKLYLIKGLAVLLK